MGAERFTTYQDGIDVAQAFRDAVENAQYEYGHRGYTGTIAEKDSWQTVTSTPLSVRDAVALADRIMSDYEHPLQDKWGPAGAIPVLSDRRQITVTVPPSTPGYKTLKEAAAAILAEGDQLLPGETVEHYTGDVIERSRRSGLIRSAELDVTLQGGPAEHRGWLFFGYASS
ncbi:hypothetical protein ABT093_19725 [Kitasatospora sp. NPDC002551]|uniref:hypothetical protein n=1 Tax=Kitasatospora sp. NPDC002551 TaxID=3154539 RepID=UPI0033221FD9